MVCGGGDVRLFDWICPLIDVNFCGGDSAAVDLLYPEAGVQVQHGYGFVRNFRIETSVDQSSEKHVAAETGEAVEIGDSHGGIVS